MFVDELKELKIDKNTEDYFIKLKQEYIKKGCIIEGKLEMGGINMVKEKKKKVYVTITRTARWELEADMTQEEYEDMRESNSVYCNAVDIVESGFFKGADITQPDDWDDDADFESEWDEEDS